MPTGRVFSFQNSPAAIVVKAGTLALICGTLTVGVMLNPSATSSQVADKPPVETTGSARSLKSEAPARDKIDPVSVSDCDQQTWPYITPHCLTERKEAAQRKVRVITTDKIAPPVVSAIEQGVKDVPPNKDPAAQKDKPARTTANLSPGETMLPATAGAPVAAGPTPAREMRSVPMSVPPLIDQNPPAGAAPRYAPANEPQTAASSGQSPHAVSTEQPSNVETKNVRDARHKRTREAKQRRAPVRDRDEDYDEPIYSPRSRVVVRWIEREYLAPSNEPQSAGPMTVIRGGDQHPFGSVFGSALPVSALNGRSLGEAVGR